MKSNWYIGFLCAAVMLCVSGCDKDVGIGTRSGEVGIGSPVGDSPSQGGYMVGGSWETGDEIGVFMVSAGGNIPGNILSPLSQPADNRRYVWNGTNFTPYSEAEKLWYPHNAGTVDMYAYYPYRPSGAGGIENHLYPVDLTDQSDPSKIDLLWSESTGVAHGSSPVQFSFSHQLSKLDLLVMMDMVISDADLARMEVKLKGVPAKGLWSLATQDFTSTDSPTDIPVRVIIPGQTYEIILIPHEGNNNRVLEFSLDNLVLRWNIPDYLYFEKGKRHRWEIVVRPTGLSVNTDYIEPWRTDTPVIPGTVTPTGISSARHLADFSAEWNAAADQAERGQVISRWSHNGKADGVIYLRKDIDMSSIPDFKPIGGSADSAFDGVFDGGGHTVKNLHVDIPGDYAGLFGYLKGTVRNLKMDVCSIEAARYAGAIAGLNYQANIANCTVSNTTVRANVQYAGAVTGQNHFQSSITGCTVTSCSITANNNAGGITGYNSGTTGYDPNGSTISVCKVTDGIVTANQSYAGGIAGENNHLSLIEDSHVSGNPGIIAESFVGGIAGSNTRSTVTGCSMTGGGVEATENYSGGIAGRNNNTATIENCAISGTSLVLSKYYSGGIAGLNNKSAIYGCSVTSGIIKSSLDNAGGIAAHNYGEGEIVCCIIRGSVSITAGRNDVGGLVGRQDNDFIRASISAPFTLSGVNNLGMLSGTINGGELNACYWVLGVLSGNDPVGANTGGRMLNCSSFQQTWVAEYDNFFTSAYAGFTPITAMNSALEEAGDSWRWKPGTAESDWWPVAYKLTD